MLAKQASEICLQQKSLEKKLQSATFDLLLYQLQSVCYFSQVYEVVPCQSDCKQYVWVAEPWSVWKVSNVDLKENCGEGVQTRRVRYLSDCLPLWLCLFVFSVYQKFFIVIEHGIYSGRPQS